jgi:type IV secretory pathway ATPase VirB11/archaellum biosynthesis ATPase
MYRVLDSALEAKRSRIVDVVVAAMVVVIVVESVGSDATLLLSSALHFAPAQLQLLVRLLYAIIKALHPKVLRVVLESRHSLKLYYGFMSTVLT